jgi:hypothetical protein
MIGKITAVKPLVIINHFEDEVMGMKYLPMVKIFVCKKKEAAWNLLKLMIAF